MGLQPPVRHRTPVKRLLLAVTLLVASLALGGCSADQWPNFAMPDPATVQGPLILDLWRWSWVAALTTGAIVWGLMFWAMIVYRRRSDDEVPVQTRYNLPLEVFYTIVPVMMVAVLFFHTVYVQNKILENPKPDLVVDVVGQQWSWTFNYLDQPSAGQVAYSSGTASHIPTLVLPVNKTVRFNLSSPDVIHSFWVAGFLMKMDVVPGRKNGFTVTPNKLGTYKGKCAELCGVYHSRMLFNLEIVDQATYDAYIQGLVKAGSVSDKPLLGGSESTTQAGLPSGGTE